MTAKIISLFERKGAVQTAPFVPLTGNPESGDYLDFLNEKGLMDGFDFSGLEKRGEIIPFPSKRG